MSFRFNPFTGTLDLVGSGGSTSPLTTKGDIYTYSTMDTRLPVGNDGEVLSADSGQTTGLKWIAAGGTGTVTSVAQTVPTGLTITGSPVTTTGTLAIGLDTGYVIPLQATLDTYVVGPASATDNAVARFNLTTGKLIQDSAVTIADTTGDITAGKYNTVAISGSSTPSLAVTGTSSISGSNTGDQTITLTGAVTGSGTGSFATTIATPGTLTVSSTNSTATAHTHAITSSSAPGAAASILATDSSGIIGSTGTRIVKIWATDLTVTNAISGSITGNAATVTTNANLTGVITSVGNATSIASQTGTGTKFVVDTSPTIVTPTIASFTNSNHNHTNSAGGGQLTDAALSSAVTVSKGGTGQTTLTTAYGLLAAGTTATGNVQTLAAGATTEILVGGGASALPVWTTATGTGSPVRATTPTFPSNIIVGTTVDLSGSISGTAKIVAPATGGGTATMFTGSDTVVGKDTTDTLTNKTLTTPIIAQINNSSAPGVKLQLRTQTDDSNSITNATTAGVFVQYGWGQVQGGGASTVSDTVTFPTAFTTVLGVMVSTGAASTGAASTISGLTIEYGNAAGINTQWSDVTTSTFGVSLGRTSGTFASGTYYGYSWVAWGI